MQVVSMARFGQKQQRWGLMKARWERGLRLEASERLYVMRSGQQSVLDAAQRRRSGAVADASREYGQISERLYVMRSGQAWLQPREDCQAPWLMQVVSMARFGQKQQR
jgi:hypothetical protein